MNRGRNRIALIALALVLVLAPGIAMAQAIISVNDNVSFKLGVLLQAQWDEQQIANAANNATGGWQQNMLLRRARIILGGQVAPNVFFYIDTDNPNLGKTTVGGTGTGAKAPATGFELQDAVAEWRIAKEFNIQFGEILVPVNRGILTSSISTFMLDGSAYYNLPSTALQNNAGRDTGFVLRGFLANDHLEYRSAFLSGMRLPGVKNATRFTEWLQYDVLDTEVYALPSYGGVNFGNRKILALGVGYDTQSDYNLTSGNLFLDLPTGFGSFESTVMYQHADGGKFITALPKQDTFSAEAGVFLKPLHIAPILRYEREGVQRAGQQGQERAALRRWPELLPVREVQEQLQHQDLVLPRRTQGRLRHRRVHPPDADRLLLTTARRTHTPLPPQPPAIRGSLFLGRRTRIGPASRSGRA